MSLANFTPKAALLWSSIPPEARAGILKEVWCGHCRQAVEIVDYTGGEKDGNLLLEGKCGLCRGRVRRFIETAEARIPPN